MIRDPIAARLRAEAARPAAPMVRFAFARTLEVFDKPTAYPSLDGLCERIHRERGDRGLELADVGVRFDGDACDRNVVAIYAQSPEGVRDACLGYAWLDGASWRALQAALYARRPNATPRAWTLPLAGARAA